MTLRPLEQMTCLLLEQSRHCDSDAIHYVYRYSLQYFPARGLQEAKTVGMFNSKYSDRCNQNANKNYLHLGWLCYKTIYQECLYSVGICIY
jgi:hypothetical protein